MMFCKDCPLPYTEGYSICDVCAHSKDELVQEYRKPSEDKRDIPIYRLNKGNHGITKL